MASTFVENKAIRHIYAFLVQRDADAEIAPSLAESWELSDGGRALIFKLRSDAKWSDGSPLTAADAKWSVDLTLEYKDGPTAVVASSLENLEGADAPDDTTLVLRYSKPTAGALDGLTYLPILPKQSWEQHVGSDGAGLARFTGADQVFGGPYELTELKPRRIVRFARNPNYYGAQPKNGGFAVLTYANPDALVTALRSDEIDLVDQPPLTTLELLRGIDGVKVDRADGFSLLTLQINTNEKKPKHRGLLDPRVRQALSLAMDRELVARDLYHGALQPDLSIVGPYAGDAHLELPGPAFDLDQANAMLDDAGYARGSGGIRLDESGEPMEFEVITASTDGSAGRVFDMARENAETIGIRLKQRVMDPASIGDYMRGPNEDYLGYDIRMNTTSNGFDPNGNMLALSCMNLDVYNPTRFCDPKLDDLYKQQVSETDPAKRAELLQEMQRVVYAGQPSIVLGYVDGLAVYRDAWTGIKTLTDGAFSSLGTDGLTGAQPAGD